MASIKLLQKVFLVFFSVLSLMLSSPAWAVTEVTKDQLAQYKKLVENVKRLKASGQRVGLYVGREPGEISGLPPGHDPLTAESIHWITMTLPVEKTTESHLGGTLGEPLVFRHQEEVVDLEKELENQLDIVTFDYGTAKDVRAPRAFVSLGRMLHKEHGKLLYPPQIGAMPILPMFHQSKDDEVQFRLSLRKGKTFGMSGFTATDSDVRWLFEHILALSKSESSGQPHEMGFTPPIIACTSIPNDILNQASLIEVVGRVGQQMFLETMEADLHRYFKKVERVKLDFHLRGPARAVEGFILSEPIREGFEAVK